MQRYKYFFQNWVVRSLLSSFLIPAQNTKAQKNTQILTGYECLNEQKKKYKDRNIFLSAKSWVVVRSPVLIPQSRPKQRRDQLSNKFLRLYKTSFLAFSSSEIRFLDALASLDFTLVSK